MGAFAFLATTAGKIVLAVVGLVVTAGVAGGSLYAMDYGVQATIVGKDCVAQTISVQEKFTRLVHTMEIGIAECSAVSEGNFAVYNIRTERVRVWESDARSTLLWDSDWLTGSGGGGGGDGGQGRGGLPFL